MSKQLTQKINAFLNGEHIAKENFDELKYVAAITGFDEKILRWFRHLQNFEVTGWRNKLVTQKICRILQQQKPLKFYSLLCPSYKKGKDAVGFRIDDVGNTTKNGIRKLAQITSDSEQLGFRCQRPEVIFFDIALEQPEKTIHMLDDLAKNVENVAQYIPPEMDFNLLSRKYPILKEIVDYAGVTVNPLPVEDDILNRIIERGKKFYQLFGWEDSQIISRSRVIASSEAIAGLFLKNDMPDAIMVYTPTMLERAQVYSGRHRDDPLAIVVPKKD